MTARFTPITCDEFAARLPELLERELDEAARAAAEAHALDCDACGALLSDLRRLSVDAANLPELAPSRDLWEGIATRIDAPVIPIGTKTGEHPTAYAIRANDRRGWRVALMAASLLFAAGVGGAVTYRFVDRGAPDSTARRIASSSTPSAANDTARGGMAVAPAESGATPASAPVTAAPSNAAPALSSRAPSDTRVSPASAVRRESAEQTFATEITRLRSIVERRRSQLDPVTISVIERNLKVIDDAIAQCKAALAKDPASRFLIESLNHALENKVELLRTAAMLPART